MSSGVEPHDWDIEAGEYVLGTLDRDERAAFTDRLRSDSDAKRSVSAWEQRLAGLAGRIDPIAPPPHVWAEIWRAIQVQDAKPHPFKVIEGGGPATDRAPKLKASRNRWRAAALAASAIAATLLVFVIDRQMLGGGSDAGDVSYVAAVNRGGDKPALLVRVDLKTRQVYVRPVAATTPTGRSLQLWYIGDDKAPRSMGLVDEVPSTLAFPKDASVTAATFAVSVEPPGGSKTGGPTGPVVYSGQLVQE